MLTNIPYHVHLTFTFAIIYVLIMFYWASNHNSKFIIGIVLWGIFHSILALSGFYENTSTIPPRFLLVGFPMIGIVVMTVFSKKVKDWMATFDLQKLTFLHVVRIPVELVLFWLFTLKYIPQIMTFEGRNFDVLIGISALIVGLIAFKNGKTNKKLLWALNIFSFVFLFNIVFYAITSLPSVFQMFGFEQPNVAVLNFPFLLLPAVIVPLVLIANLAGFVVLSRCE